MIEIATRIGFIMQVSSFTCHPNTNVMSVATDEIAAKAAIKCEMNLLIKRIVKRKSPSRYLDKLHSLHYTDLLLA